MDKALSNNPTVSITNTIPNSHSQTTGQTNQSKISKRSSQCFAGMLACRILSDPLATKAFCCNSVALEPNLSPME